MNEQVIRDLVATGKYGLLRARRERPRSGRATEHRDELATPCMSGKEHCEG